MPTKTWSERDLQHIWHPCSQMKDYETLPPIVIDHGEGSYLYDVDDHKYLDIVSSWWCNLLGHCHPAINAAIKKQLDELEHVIFANFSHRPAIELAEKLVSILPKGLTKLNFADNGSSAVESALKMAFQYHQQTGHPEKQKFMCLSEGYHGETIGALSVGSMDVFTQIYKPMMMKTIHIEAPDCYRCPYKKSRESCQCECFQSAEEAFAQYGRETAAFIAEPLLQGCAGMRIYPPLYLQKLRRLCDQYGVLLIIDEIATGFGRTGKRFACDHAGITPDLMCLSKALTGGYMPMSIIAATDAIYDAFYDDYHTGKAFLHSHTYSGNPLGCAAALAVLQVMESEKILEKANAIAPFLTASMEDAFGKDPHVGEIRHIGLIHAMELVQDKKTAAPFPASERIGYQIYKKALSYGLLLRPLGNVLYFNPPLTITKGEIEEAIALCRKAMDDILY